jgi:RNA polymerase sigma-70 factor (ECF subfamily)
MNKFFPHAWQLSPLHHALGGRRRKAMTNAIQSVMNNFETVALPHINDLYRTARRTMGNPSDAEDVVQETYLQAWKSFHRFESGTNIRAWLFKILFHVASHHRRKLFKLKQADVNDEMIAETIAYEATPPPNLRDEEVLTALEKIPQNYRAVLLLADVQEFSYKEIAEILHIPIGTVMSRLSRGRGSLRDALSNTRIAASFVATKRITGRIAVTA